MATAWRVRMGPRDVGQAHRVSTPLELFFDLCFVVAVAQAASALHHGLVEDHVRQVVSSYPLVFFGIWWAWVNFTWFASAYDTDDVPYRLAVLVQIAGVLVLGAGVPRAMAERDFGIIVLGYVILRTALVALWLRAARSHPEGRRCAHRFAAGITVCQLGWIGLLAVPHSLLTPAFLALVAAELLVPVYAERAGRTSWHPHHIVERYGLFTLIVLGESVLAASTAFQTALDTDHAPAARLAAIAVGGLLIVFSMWWTYFEQPADAVLGQRNHRAFVWGYGHLAVFASAAAVGAGLEVAVDKAAGHAALSTAGAGAAVTVPVAIYLVSTWALHANAKPQGWLRTYGVPVTAALVLATSWSEEAPLLTGGLVAALLAGALVTRARAT